MSDENPTPKEIMERIPSAFKPEKATGVTAVFQWDVGGEQGGHWFVTVKDSACQVEEGQTEAPNITLTIADDNFVKLLTGKLDGTVAFMTGKLKVKGDMGLAMKLPQLFNLR
ncbi:MAG: SCP2 sterol-binding domain-containing protein [Candidatus Dormibacteraeota bacterium]|nr:SCP2 sterol-binding domain-containing protein [Candidatus Dormibacteraeota bacterium]